MMQVILEEMGNQVTKAAAEKEVEATDLDRFHEGFILQDLLVEEASHDPQSQVG